MCLPSEIEAGAQTRIRFGVDAPDREVWPLFKVVREEYQAQQNAPAAVGGSLLDELARDGSRQLLEFSDYLAEHWIHIRTANPIESAFPTVSLRQRVTKGPCSRVAGIAIAFTFIESGQTGGAPPTHPPRRPRPRPGTQFNNGKLVEQPEEPAVKSEGEATPDDTTIHRP